MNDRPSLANRFDRVLEDLPVVLELQEREDDKAPWLDDPSCLDQVAKALLVKKVCEYRKKRREVRFVLREGNASVLDYGELPIGWAADPRIINKLRYHVGSQYTAGSEVAD